MSNTQVLLNDLPLPTDTRRYLSAVLPTLDPSWGIRAMVLHGADELLRPLGPQAVESYRAFDRRLPQVARFSFMPLGEFHLRFLKLTTLLHPDVELEEAMSKAADSCMSAYLQKSRALRITQMGMDDQLGLYIQTATDLMQQFINFVKTHIQRLGTHHVHVQIHPDPTQLVSYLSVPFYNTLFHTFSVEGNVQVVRDHQLTTDLILDLTWSGEPPSLADIQRELVEMLKKGKDAS